MKRVAITGASGFVGRALTAALVQRGYGVIALGRDPDALQGDDAIEPRRFDGDDAGPNPDAFAGADAVVHLAGESVSGRWTAAKKRAIYKSRVAGTRLLVRSLALCHEKPAVLVSASAVGYYGSRGDQALFESAPPGSGFLADVCKDWEREASAAEPLGIRTIRMRTGIVLANGGALEAMIPPFRFGGGGPLGSGRQFFPWIALDDLVALYIFALEREDLSGAVNAVTPDYATSARVANAIGSALRRPALAPAPAFALRALLGEFAHTLLASQLVIPAVAEDRGFSWQHPTLEAALLAILAPAAQRSPVVRTFDAEQYIAAPLQDVFAFFAEARNLETITPPALRFAIDSIPQHLERGAQIAYHLRLHRFPLRWRTMIARWNPPHEFVDVQLHGPYSLWRHTHRFRAVDGGTVATDHVDYGLPLWPAGNIALRLVESDVRRIFAYRRTAIGRAFDHPDGNAAVTRGMGAHG
ncbi:MAG: TIGR01777 family oxidoreductase [Candidatus Eremiobacteraeota bacterium]|nr:TIGR01777 family oxidoreductase [Candidatus Eremiobacteraeota bacterium]